MQPRIAPWAKWVRTISRTDPRSNTSVSVARVYGAATKSGRRTPFEYRFQKCDSVFFDRTQQEAEMTLAFCKLFHTHHVYESRLVYRVGRYSTLSGHLQAVK
ncbi:hypothetical protein VTG60DRAFT_4795 [Thermothelomyces hinnuleus]